MYYVLRNRVKQKLVCVGTVQSLFALVPYVRWCLDVCSEVQNVNVYLSSRILHWCTQEQRMHWLPQCITRLMQENSWGPVPCIQVGNFTCLVLTLSLLYAACKTEEWSWTFCTDHPHRLSISILIISHDQEICFLGSYDGVCSRSPLLWRISISFIKLLLVYTI